MLVHTIQIAQYLAKVEFSDVCQWDRVVNYHRWYVEQKMHSERLIRVDGAHRLRVVANR